MLGAGGVVGTAWMAGLVAGLRDHGVNLAEADLVVGTSAGAIIGAMLATGQELGPLATPPDTRHAPPAPNPDRLGEVFAVLGDPTLDPNTARRQVGCLAAAAGMAEPAQLARVEALITAREWPERRLLITTVDTETGQRHTWDRASGVPLVPAVASSMAFPVASPPITVNGRRYMDGGLWSGTNADLAAGASTLVVIEPLAHLFPREPLRQELAAVAADALAVINPDPSAVAAFGSDLYQRAAWQPAYHAGTRQAVELAPRLHATWHSGHTVEAGRA
ncbi:patatin-like phospholipase [Kutzneria sp. CA-103260]|nr:patatin-like phospholipase [Kutzneria sp. CA-103260]